MKQMTDVVPRQIVCVCLRERRKIFSIITAFKSCKASNSACVWQILSPLLAVRVSRVRSSPRPTWAFPGSPWSTPACWVRSPGRPSLTGASRVCPPQPRGDGPAGRRVLTHVRCLTQVKRKRRRCEACAAPWPPSPATSLWPAWSPTSVWPAPQQRWAAPASRHRRAWRRSTAAAFRALGGVGVHMFTTHWSSVFLLPEIIRCYLCKQQKRERKAAVKWFYKCAITAATRLFFVLWSKRNHMILFSGKDHFNVQLLQSDSLNV